VGVGEGRGLGVALAASVMISTGYYRSTEGGREIVLMACSGILNKTILIASGLG
jgi:hypothetical protein